MNSNWYRASAGITLTAALAGIAESQGKINLDAKTSVVSSQNLVVIRVGDAPDTNLIPYTFQNDFWAVLNEIITE